jgi:hypothetical protein
MTHQLFLLEKSPHPTSYPTATHAVSADVSAVSADVKSWIYLMMSHSSYTLPSLASTLWSFYYLGESQDESHSL